MTIEFDADAFPQTVRGPLNELYDADVIATETRYNPDLVEIRHNIRIPRADEKGRFIALRSIYAFHLRERERVYGEKGRKSGDWLAYARSIPVKFGIQPRAHFEYKDAMMNARCEATGITPYPDYDYSQTIEHVSVWDFYKYINYDYKKQKFL